MAFKVKKTLTIFGIVIGSIVVVTGVGLFILSPRPLKPPAAVNSLAELETYLENLAGHNADSPPGVSLAVVKDGTLVYQKGFGKADGPKNIQTAADTVYNTWSMVKPITAAAVLQLQEQGLLDIDDPVADYLPFFQVRYPSEQSETVTIRHLMNHSSGLSNNVPEILRWIHFDGDQERNQTELIEEKFPDYAELSYEQGTKAVYSNVGYMVLTAVIEAVSGQSYQQYMIDHIFKPLKMTDTSWVYSESTADREAAGSNPRVDLQALLLPMLLDKSQMNALIRERAGGLLWLNRVYTDQKGPTGPISTVVDMGRFLMAILNNGELDGRRILSEESVAQMITEGHVLPGNTPEARDMKAYKQMYHGLGWYVVKNPEVDFIAHSGGGPGFASDMRLYPDRDLGMVVIGNGTYLPAHEINDLVAGLDW
jgi:CubicO group peptidase (beta-lactamase class C family)